MTSRPSPLAEAAPAKINLTLEIRGRRPDGYHEIDSLVVFAQLGDRLSLQPGKPLGLDLDGPFAAASGAVDDNLVLRAARALASRVEGLVTGRFALVKELPVAAGIGGGSADAAAALRLLAHTNAIAPDDRRLVDAALATGADVPVCLDPRPRVMTGIGEKLSAPIALASQPAVLVNAGVPVATKEVFGVLAAPSIAASPSTGRHDIADIPRDRAALTIYLRARRNDLEKPAIAIAPVIATVLASLAEAEGCELARMSGSGGTCFGLFATQRAAAAAAARLSAAEPGWWVRATELG